MKTNKSYILALLIISICFCCIHICSAQTLRGDMNNDSSVTSDDAIYLLRHTLNNGSYPILQNGDLNRDNAVNSDDSIYLLRQTLLSASYPIDCDTLGHAYDGGVCQYCGEEDAFDVSVFASDVYYNSLAQYENQESLQGFYNELDVALTAFHNDVTLDAQEISSGENTWNAVAANDYSKWGLTYEEAALVWEMYRIDHPMYYWLLEYVYSSTHIFSTTYSEFALGASRAEYNEKIYAEVSRYTELVKDEHSEYRIALLYYNAIISNCNMYALEGSVTFQEIYRECTVVGPLIDKVAYNSGFATLYNMLLNYSGIENIYAWNTNPLFDGWNIAKLDDGRSYWFDMGYTINNAWGEWDIYQYFCGTSANLPQSHESFLPTCFADLYKLSDSVFDAEDLVEVHSNFTVDNVEYKLLNLNGDVIAVDFEFDARDNVSKNVAYNGTTYNVIDVFDHRDTEINSVMFESNVSYDYLGTLSNGEAMQALYEELDGRFTRFHLCDESLVAKISVSDVVYYVIARVDYAKYGLTYADAAAVWQFYRNDHPLYYWLYYGWVFDSTNGYIYPCTVAEYDTVAERSLSNELVYDGILEYIDEADGITNAYSLSLCYYDAIVDACSYALDSSQNPESALWAHSIIGAFEYNSFVCEGYAKLLQLLLNYSGVENHYITGDAGGNHAWNLVKMDDGNWYWCDATWGDPEDTGNEYYYTFFCGTDTEFSTHTPNATTNSTNPARVLATVPERSSSRYSNVSVLKLLDIFSVDGVTYKRMQYDEAARISGLTPDGEIPQTVTYGGVTYTVLTHTLSTMSYINDQYVAYCPKCGSKVILSEASSETLELTFEEDIETEISKYNGFEAVSPQSFNIVTDSGGNNALSCGTSYYYLNVDRKTLADLKLFSISFDLTITKAGFSGSEISLLSIIGNYHDGKLIDGETAVRGWFLKYNTKHDRLATVKSSAQTLDDSNSISVELNKSYKVTVLFDVAASSAYVSVDGVSIGEVSDVTFPDLNDEKYDEALSLCFNDGGNCAPVFDNFKIEAIK